VLRQFPDEVNVSEPAPHRIYTMLGRLEAEIKGL